MRNVWKLLPLVLFVWSCFAVSAPAEERYLDALGRIQVRFDSFDELKPLACVSVSSITEWPGATDVIDAMSEPFAEKFAEFCELEDKILEDGDKRLSSLLCETSLAGNFQFRLLLGNEAVYPVFFFPLKTAQNIPNQTYSIKKMVVPFSGGQEIGFQQISWGACGQWGYITMPNVGEVLAKLSSEQLQQLINSATPTEPGEVASMTVHFDSVPKGTMQIADVMIASFLELLPYSYSIIDYDLSFEEYTDLSNINAISFYTMPLKDLRATCEGVRQFTGRVILDPESGDLVLAATTEFVPDSALARQNQTRYEHRQTLAGFYQPDDAIFAFAEGMSPRLEQQAFSVSFANLYISQIMSDLDFDALLEGKQAEIDAMKNLPQEDDEETSVKDEAFSKTGFTVSVGGLEREIILDETTPEKSLEGLEKELAAMKDAIPLVEQMLEKTLFPSLKADWQEIAVTVNSDASILGAFRVTNGQTLADIADLYAKYAESEIDSNPDYTLASLQAHNEAYKGFRLFSLNMPIPKEAHKLRIKSVSHETKEDDSKTELIDFEEDGREALQEFAMKNIWSDNEQMKTEEISERFIQNFQYHQTIEEIVTHFIYDVPENASEERQQRITQYNAKSREEMEAIEKEFPETEHEITESASYFVGQNFQYHLAISDDVVALLMGSFAENALPQLKEAIDRNETEQKFPETIAVFSIPDMQQLQRLAGYISTDSNFEMPSVDELESMGFDWPQGKISVRANLTETSRTDRLQISRSLITSLGELLFKKSDVTAEDDDESEEPAEE